MFLRLCLARHGEASGIRKDPDGHLPLGAPTPPAPIGEIPKVDGVVMTAQVVPFTFQEQHPVRITVIDNEPWFCLVDVCDVLEIKNSRQVAQNQLAPLRSVYTGRPSSRVCVTRP